MNDATSSTAPWTWLGGETPSEALRYGARELGWWARWFATGSGPSRLAPRAAARATGM